MRKILMLSLCIVCVIAFSAYDWGRKSAKASQTTYEADEVQKDGWDTYSETEEAMSAAVESDVQEEMAQETEKYNAASKEVTKAMATASDPKSTAAPSVTPAAGPLSMENTRALITLSKIVGTGTPEERKARIESLKRLSEALAKSQAKTA